MTPTRATTRRATRRALGFCERCGNPREGEGATSTRCAPCADALRLYASGRRVLLIAAGLCVRCGHERGEGDLTLCGECKRKGREYGRKRLAAARAAGCCLWCGEPSGGFQYCFRHRVRAVGYWEKYEASRRAT